MWDDININDCGWIFEESFKWLNNFTKFFENPSNLKIVSMQLASVNKSTNINNDISKYFINDIVFDKHYANILFQQHLSYGQLKDLQFLDLIIRRKYPDLIKYNQRFMITHCLSRKNEDKLIKWVIKTYLIGYRWVGDRENGDFNYDLGPNVQCLDVNIANMLRYYNFNSAKLLLGLFKGDILTNYYIKRTIKKCINDKTKMLKIIDILRLDKPGSEIAFIRIFQKDPKSLHWFWKQTNILPNDKTIWECQEYIIRSAKIAYALIKFNHEFSRIKYVVDQFDNVLKLVSSDNYEVKRFISKVEYRYKIRDPEMGYLMIENLNRISYYIKAGNVDKLNYLLKRINSCSDHIMTYLSEWMKLAKEYSICVYNIIRDKHISISNEIDEKKLEERQLDEEQLKDKKV
jgi:hypothetical protein